MEQYLYPLVLANHWNDITLMVQDNYPLNSEDCLIVGGCAINDVDCYRKYNPGAKKYIAYQLEPLNNKNHWHSRDKIVKNLNGADEVWDYDLDNIEILKSYGIKAKYRPFLFSETLQRVKNRDIDGLDIDVLFYGTIGLENRMNIISDIPTDNGLSLDYNIFFIHGEDGLKLDEYISRAKIILDMHTSGDGETQKQSRIYYGLINNKCIVSQISKYNYFGDMIIEAKGKDLLKTVNYILDSGLWKELSTKAEEFRCYSNTIKKKHK